MRVCHDRSHYSFIISREEATTLTYNSLSTRLSDRNGYPLPQLIRLQIVEHEKSEASLTLLPPWSCWEEAERINILLTESFFDKVLQNGSGAIGLEKYGRLSLEIS